MLENILKKANLTDVLIVVLSSIGIVGFWRGTWNLLDAYLIPNYFLWSQITSIIGGIAILIVLSRYR